MMFPMIYNYYEDSKMRPHSFYLVCRGALSGVPSLQPAADSYIVVCPHQVYFEFYYWLFYCLHRTGKFNLKHSWSTPPCIHLETLRNHLRVLAPQLYPVWSHYQDLLRILNMRGSPKESLEEQIFATKEMSIRMLLQFFGNKKIQRWPGF